MADSSQSRADTIRQRLTDKKAWIAATRNLLTPVALLALGPFVYLLFVFPMQLWRAHRLLLSFRGRITRKMFLGVFPVYMLYGGLVYGVIGAALPDPSSPLRWSLIGALVAVPIALSALAMGTKRLHDRDKSGWWLSLFYGVPAVLVVMSCFVSMQQAVYVLPTTAILIWAFIELVCRRGSVGRNNYGYEMRAV